MSIPVVGLDIGYQSCYIGLARGGGIETAANEVSERATATCVSFGDKSRCVGSSAKQQQVSNYKNTVSGFTRLLGRSFKDPIVQEECLNCPYKIVEDKRGKANVQVRYMNETQNFEVEQITAMLLTRLKHIVEDNLQVRMVDCVISVPTYFTDAERRAMLDAANIAGLNCVRLMNDTTAVGLAYGFFKKDLPGADKPPRITMFVDVGHSSTKTSVVAFNEGKMKVLATSCDQRLGGRDFDRCIFDQMVTEFAKKYRLDVKSSPKACIRLMTECEKLKKLMSANSTALPINIECFMEDKDVSSRMKREDFESLAAPLYKRFEKCLKQVLSEAQLQTSDLYSVEIVGGATRIPALKRIVREVTGMEPSTTLNADEAVARGCTLQSAIFSPSLRVPNFQITDAQAYPIKLQWQDPNTALEDYMEIFPAWHQIPFSRQITFYRKEPFMLEAVYSKSDGVQHTQKSLGRYIIQNVKPTAEDESMKVLLKLRVNLHGVFSVSQAHYVEKYEVEEEYIPEQQKPAQNGAAEESKGDPKEAKDSSKESEKETVEAMDTSDSNTPAPDVKEEKESKPPKSTRIVTKQKKIELPIESEVMQLDQSTLTDYTDRESKMIMQDKLERERSNAKNALEEYVYEIRDKIYDQFEGFMTENERETVSKALTNMEDWLYDEGDDEIKQAYVDRLQSLRTSCSKYQIRYTESIDRPAALDDLGRAIMRVSKAIKSYEDGDEEYSHIDKSEMVKVSESLKEVQVWMNDQMNAQSKLKPTDDPVLVASAVTSKLKKLESECNPILTKPKPKPKEEPPKDTKDSSQSNNADESQTNENNVNSKEELPEQSSKETKEDMDLD